MRKLFTLVLALVAAASLWAYDFKSGDLCYEITSSHNSSAYTVEVTYDDSYKNHTFLTIPATVNYQGITYAVTNIGYMAFSDCHSLASCYIFGNLTGIAKMAFSDCSNLTTIFIQNVEWIGDYAFSGCSSLSSINIPENVEFIGEGCFLGCGALTKVNYNGTQTSWDQVAKNSDWMDGSSIEFIHCWDMMIAMEEEEVEIEIMQEPAEVEEEVEEEEAVYIVVENMPEFPDGQQAMMKFIAENIQYPVIAMENGIQGRVICQFVVEKDGRISDIQVVRTSGDASLDKEAVRVISSMPKWKPGRQSGKPVRVTYTLPVSFRLQ